MAKQYSKKLMYFRCLENKTIALVPIGHFQQLVNVNHSWLILMQTCGISAEFERNRFKMSKFHRTNESLFHRVFVGSFLKRNQKICTVKYRCSKVQNVSKQLQNKHLLCWGSGLQNGFSAS